MFALTDRLAIGVEVNPLDDDVGPLVNWRLVDETERRPALILGTSSDRIGTPSGRAYYATLSKDLEGWIGLPIAPYAGTAYGGFEHEWELIGGLRVRWGTLFETAHMWDGENLHHLVERAFGRYRIGGLAVEQDGTYYFGVSLGLSF